MDDVENRFTAENQPVVFRRPRAPLVDHRSTSGAVAADLVDLHERRPVGQILARHRSPRIHRTHTLPPIRPRPRQNSFRKDHVLKRISVGRLPMKNFHVTRHLRSKTVSPLRCHLLNRAPIRLKPKDSRGNLRHHLTCSALGRRTPAARTRVNPAVRCRNEMIGDKVGVPRRKPSVENHFLVRLPIAIRIAEPKNVRLRNHDHPIAIHAKTRDQFEALMEDVLFVHDPVPVRIHEHADGIASGAVVMSRIEHPTFLPSVCGQRSTPIRILGGFRHPHPPAPIPLHGDRFGNQGLGSHDARLKTGLHLKRLDGVGWAQRSA